MYYWRAGIKCAGETSYTIVYFHTERLDYVGDVAEMLESYGLQTCNCYFRRLSAFEYMTTALFLPVATVDSFQNHSRSVLVG